MKLIKKILGSAILAGLSISSAMAANVTGNFQASSTLNATCSVTATDIAFGQFTGAQKDVNGSFTALCSKSVFYTVLVSAGQSGNVLDRKLKGAIVGNADQLSYQIYNGSNHVDIWAAQTGQSGSNALAFSASGGLDTNILYARLKAGNQYVLADSYADSLVLTVSY